MLDKNEILMFPQSCRNLMKKPWACNPKIVGFIYGTLIKASGSYIIMGFYGRVCVFLSHG